jgi:hypothetical protein
MKGHLHPVERTWRSEDHHGSSAPPSSHGDIEDLRTAIAAAVSMRKERRRQEALYSELAKSVKERCIRVAAIDITISAGA